MHIISKSDVPSILDGDDAVAAPIPHEVSVDRYIHWYEFITNCNHYDDTLEPSCLLGPNAATAAQLPGKAELLRGVYVVGFRDLLPRNLAFD